MSLQFRQGDLLLVQVESIPEQSSHLAHGVVLEGEKSGHMHTVDTSYAGITESRGERFLSVMKQTELKHPEHEPITLPKGTYKIIQQRQYDPQKDASRPVSD